jgi:hypothetical protein
MNAKVSVDNIESLFPSEVREDLKETNDSLRVSIRITINFYDYLMTHESFRDDYDTEYMADTIRSGMDFFFNLKQYFQVCSEKSTSNDQCAIFHSDLNSFKSDYIKLFSRMLEEGLDTWGIVECLLSLIAMALEFLAIHFKIVAVACGLQANSGNRN